MAAAAVTSPACPLRRSSRLTPRRDDDDDQNELTPRALRALKRQRLALHIPPRPKRRRKENLPPPPPDPIKDPPPEPPSPEPLTPLTPLTPSPSPSPSLPGHDRPTLPPSPPHDPVPQPPSDPFAPPPLDPALDALIPFDGLHTPFPHDLPPVCQPPPPPLQQLDLQDHFHSFPQQQLYVPPPLFVRDREINIWKLACQERVDCLFRRYGTDYIKAIVRSEARSLSNVAPLPTSPSTSHTKFRLYTPASYTYSSTSWGSTSRPPKAFPLDDEPDEHDAPWPIDDADWADADVDMEDEDEDDYEDEDEVPEPEPDREGETTLQPTADATCKATPMQVDPPEADTEAKTAPSVDPPLPSCPPPSMADPPPRPLTPPLYLPPPPLTPPSLPPLSSLHVPLLSEPPRAFMGRGTPPDRRRLVEWSDSGRFPANGMGPPLYLSPVPQRHPSPDVGIVPMSVDPPMPSPSHTAHSNGEWTSFLFSVLEGDGVGVDTSVVNAPHPSEPTWYELSLGSVPNNELDLPLSHSHTHTRPAVEQPVEDGSSSSTLRFALG